MNVVLNQRPNPNPRLRTLRLANTALNLLRWSGDGWQLVLGDVGEFAAAPPVAASSGAGSHCSARARPLLRRLCCLRALSECC